MSGTQNRSKKKAFGTIALVAVGPGDPDLLTLRAAALLREADVVLADADVVDLARSFAGPDADVSAALDEAQFMAPASLHVIKLALRPGGSMFLCADPRQGFLKNRLSWKRVGLAVAGRTKKLRRSYRTTRALLQAATRMLARQVDEDPEA